MDFEALKHCLGMNWLVAVQKLYKTARGKTLALT